MLEGPAKISALYISEKY